MGVFHVFFTFFIKSCEGSHILHQRSEDPMKDPLSFVRLSAVPFFRSFSQESFVGLSAFLHEARLLSNLKSDGTGFVLKKKSCSWFFRQKWPKVRFFKF